MALSSYLDFEKPLADLEKKIAELETAGGEAVGDEVSKLRETAAKQLEHIYGHLNAWQKTQVARHPDRPHFPTMSLSCSRSSSNSPATASS
jgi:acetyl-CoA carboxylase carboxyl transferase subunit alpha